MKNRIEFIDLAKGICISLVVLLHVFGDLSGTPVKIMNLFRMPLYFVLSGLFFKTYDVFFTFLKKKINKLIIPFAFTFFFIIIPTSWFLATKMGNNVHQFNIMWGGEGKLNLGIDGAAWFLVCLFFMNVFFYFIFYVSRKNVLLLIFFSGICGLVGYALNVYNFYLPMWTDSALTAIPFFMIGYLLKQKTNILNSNYSSKDSFVFGLSFFVLMCVYMFDEWEGESLILYSNNIYDISIMSLYVGGISGTLCVLMLSKYLNYISFLSYIGRYSIVVLLTHLLYLFLIRNILYQLEITQESITLNSFVFLFIMILEIPTIYFCVKNMPYCFAQKDLLK